MNCTPLRVGFCAALLALVACSPAVEEPPPLFNAVDPSQACEPGRVGWDFSTAGNDTDIVENDTSQAIKVVQATYGAACGATPGNYTQDFGLSCDGQADCTRTVRLPTSPEVPCTSGRDFVITYRCGEDPTTFEVTRPADASGATVRLICGARMTVVSATYASNKTPTPPTGNLTSVVSAACSGKRRCVQPRGQVLYRGGDPWTGQSKLTEVRYYCGGDNVQHVATFQPDERLDFFCELDATPPKTPDAMHFGDVVPSFTTDARIAPAVAQMTTVLRAACDTKTECTVQLPALQEFTDLRGVDGRFLRLGVNYTCGGDQLSTVRSLTVAELGAPLKFQCGERITITDLTPATGFTELKSELLSAMKTQCDGKRLCNSPKGQNLLADAGRYLGGSTVKYTCGDATFIEKQAALSYATDFFECPVQPNQFARGIRIRSATSVTPNDQLVRLTNLCFGRDFCTLPRDMARLTVTYSCGASNEVRTTPENAFTIECRPTAEIVSIGGCPRLEGLQWTKTDTNYACALQPGTCNVDLNQPFARRQLSIGTCTKATAEYRCGNDPTLKTASVGDGSAEVRTLTLTCETPTQGYSRRACVPKKCTGCTRRDKDLECVQDNSKNSTSYQVKPLVLIGQPMQAATKATASPS